MIVRSWEKRWKLNAKFQLYRAIKKWCHKEFFPSCQGCGTPGLFEQWKTGGTHLFHPTQPLITSPMSMSGGWSVVAVVGARDAPAEWECLSLALLSRRPAPSFRVAVDVMVRAPVFRVIHVRSIALRTRWVAPVLQWIMLHWEKTNSETHFTDSSTTSETQFTDSAMDLFPKRSLPILLLFLKRDLQTYYFRIAMQTNTTPPT